MGKHLYKKARFGPIAVGVQQQAAAVWTPEA